MGGGVTRGNPTPGVFLLYSMMSSDLALRLLKQFLACFIFAEFFEGAGKE